MIRWRILLLVLFSWSLVGCTAAAADDEATNGRPNVVATTGQIADAVAHIAGDQVNLTSLFGPGIDPHLYVPTEGDVSTLSEADIIFYNGLHLEAQMVRIMEQLAESKVVVPLGDRLPEEQLRTWDANTPYDPHIWNDPLLWQTAVTIIRDTLIAADPNNSALYTENTEAYLAEIAATDAFIREQIERIPPDKRVLITAHDAFGYFARTYGLEERGLQGISTESEAGTQDVQNLAAFIVERQIPAIFVESSVPPGTIEAVQAAVQNRGFAVAIGGELFSDALGEAGHEASTYNGMLRYNARTLADALAGE
jgi:manganese/zinc/iron transport system substrate-binding protein